jgi:C4-dicarboxylate-specific signal transduction histidine kinase
VDATATRFDRRDGSKGVQITLHDATESVRRQEHEDGVRERLEQANRLDSIGRLAGGVAHDFNNHLTVIGASAEMLMSGEEPDTKKLGRSILEAKLRAATLTTRLLAFARRDVVVPPRAPSARGAQGERTVVPQPRWHRHAPGDPG